MKKRKYVGLELEVVSFYLQDVLTASVSDIEEDWDDENEYGSF
jgi:hypothetical protein